MSKYHSKRTESKLLNMTFDSKLEKERAEQLYWMQKAGEIRDLEFQVPFVLCDIPGYKVKMIIDFSYIEILKWTEYQVYEDAKGHMTKDWRVKMCWLKKDFGIDVRLYKGDR